MGKSTALEPPRIGKLRASLKQFGSILAVAGLLVRLLVAMVVVPAMAASDASAAATADDNFKLVYCSLLGKMNVPVSPDGTPESPDMAECSLCQAISASAFALPTTIGDLPVPQTSLGIQVVDHGDAVPPSRPFTATARGPPTK